MKKYILRSAYGALGTRSYHSFEDAQRAASRAFLEDKYIPHIDICLISPVSRVKHRFDYEEIH